MKGTLISGRLKAQSLLIIATVLAAALVCLYGCGSSEVSSGSSGGASGQNTEGMQEVGGLIVPEKEYEAVCVIVGNTANEPAPQINDAIAPYLNSAFLVESSGAKIDMSSFIFISAAGSSTHESLPLDSSGLKAAKIDGNENNNVTAASANFQTISEAISVDPGTNHVDFFGALKEASRRLKNYSGPKLIIMIGSGVNDAGDLNFALNTGLINQNPSDVTKSILSDSSTNVSSTTLENCDVVWAGLGDTTLPQPELKSEGENSIDNLAAIYKSLIEGMGGAVVMFDMSQTDNPSIQTSYTVTPFVFDDEPLVWEDSGNSTEWHFTETSLAFNPDEATFVDAASAKEALKSVAEEINANSAAKITITGYQAATSAKIFESTSDLTRARAQAVSDMLVNELGVSPSAIEAVVGGGTGTFVDEFDDDGNWSDDLASFNRVVVISSQH